MKGLRSNEVRLHIEGRSASHTSTQTDPSRVAQFQYTSDPASSSGPLIRIQQATISTEQQFTIPFETTSRTSSSTMLATPSEASTPSGEGHRLSSTSIAGLAMIPIAVLLIAVTIFAYFWLRKRRRRTPVIRHLGVSPPPVPEKDFGSPASSFDSTTSGGKVRSLTAMSTPVEHPGWHAPPHPQADKNAVMQYNPWNDQLPKVSADITTMGFVARRAVREGNDSPTDRGSPFRLKRGDTTRNRSSLDPDLMGAWPAPPQPLQPAARQPFRTGKTYMERRSISAEYFEQEKPSRDARGVQEYWEEIGLELNPNPGPMMKT